MELFFPIRDRASGTSPRALEPPNGLASHIRERALDQVDAHDAKMPSGGNGGKPPRATEGVGPSSQGSTPQSSVPPSAGHSRQASWSIAEDPGTYRRSTSSVDFTDLAGAGAMPPPPARPPSRGAPASAGGAVPVNSSNPPSRPISRSGTESEQLSAMVHVPKGSLEVGNVIVAHDKLVSSGALGLIPGGAASAKPRPLGPKAWLKMDEEGACTAVSIEKHRLASMLRVPMRDLRMLEPNFSNSYSAAILCRERCIVLHLEQVRLLITAEEVYLQDGRNSSVTKYLPELQRRLLMRKLKLMDSHGVPNFDTPPDRSSRAYESDTEPSEPPSEKESPERVTKRGESLESQKPDPLLKTKKPDPTDTDEDVSVRAGRTRLEAVGMRRSASSEELGRIAATKTEAVGKSGKSPLGPGVGSGSSKDDRSNAPSSPRKPRSPKNHHSGVIHEEGSLRRALSIQRGGDAPRQEELPFELIALEVALEIVCNSLEAEQRETVTEAKAGLEGLRKKVNTNNLERVRRVKSRVTRLTGRVAKVREEIKRYLDDDSDMRDMYLTRRLLAELFGGAEARGGGMGGMGGEHGAQTPGGGIVKGHHHDSPRFSVTHARAMRRSSVNLESKLDSALLNRGGERPGLGDKDPGGVKDGFEMGGVVFDDAPAAGGYYEEEEEWVDPKDEDKDLQEVEDLLETYFTHIDSTFAELQALDEYIDDTEDFVNIELDSQRNQLIKLELVLTTATLFMTMYGVVASVFGMNVRNGAEDSKASFVVINVVCSVCTVLAFVLAVTYIRYKRIM